MKNRMVGRKWATSVVKNFGWSPREQRTPPAGDLPPKVASQRQLVRLPTAPPSYARAPPRDPIAPATQSGGCTSRTYRLVFATPRLPKPPPLHLPGAAARARTDCP